MELTKKIFEVDNKEFMSPVLTKEMMDQSIHLALTQLKRHIDHYQPLFILKYPSGKQKPSIKKPRAIKNRSVDGD